MRLQKTFAALSLAAGAYAEDAQFPLQSISPDGLTIRHIPLLGFGIWNLKTNCSQAVSYAIQTGYRHIDCAASYGNEAEVGAGIADGLARTGLSRSDLWITSKLWNDHHDLNDVEKAIDESLLKLGVGYLDLYLMHFPVADKFFGGHSIDYNDAWGGMTLLKAKGKARHIGVSNFSPEQLEDLLNHTMYKPDAHQMEMHPYLQQNEWREWHQKHRIHVTAYSPLGGSYSGDEDDAPERLLNNTVILKIAKNRFCTPAQVILAWGLSRGTSVIPKSSHSERIRENYKSWKCDLGNKDLRKIDKLGAAHFRYSNPSEDWGVDLFKGLEDSKGKHKKHS